MLGNASTEDDDAEVVERLDQFLYSLNLMCCVLETLM